MDPIQIDYYASYHSPLHALKVVGYKHIEIYGPISFPEEGIFVSLLGEGDTAIPLSELGAVSCCAPMILRELAARRS